MRLVSAPSGNTAWTCGTTVLLRIPPSGPMRLLSCLIRDTTAKYCGKSRVMMRQMRFLSSSSGGSSPEMIRDASQKMNATFKWKWNLLIFYFRGSPSSVPLRIWLSSSSVYSQWCSFQLSPVSLLKITSSLSFPLRAAKWGISTITGLIFNREECSNLFKSRFFWLKFFMTSVYKILGQNGTYKTDHFKNLINAHNHKKTSLTQMQNKLHEHKQPGRNIQDINEIWEHYISSHYD